jgi:uncharacterized protein YjbI with pentapeptide repeats
MERWTTPPGIDVSLRLHQYIRSRDIEIGSELLAGPEAAARDMMKSLIDGMPFVDEVAPALDLRGLKFEPLVWLRCIVLDGARFEHSELPAMAASSARRCAFDQCTAKGVRLGGNFAECSFREARLRECDFCGSVLEAADFGGAQLTNCRFVESDCRRANFSGAKMRFVEMPMADLCGANLSGADLTDAVLGKVRFDDSTRMAGAVLTGASVSPDFLAYSLEAGAVRQESVPSAWVIAVLDDTCRRIERQRGVAEESLIDAALTHVKDAKARYLNDPAFDWMNRIETECPPHLRALVFEAWQDAMLAPGE